MLSNKIEEIKNNVLLTKIDTAEMAYYIRQTFERYSAMICSGYLLAEEQFKNPNGAETEVNPFNPESTESLEYAKTHLKTNLEIMHHFIYDADEKLSYLHKVGATDGTTMGGLNDFLFETLPPCIAYQSLNEAGVMDTFYGSEKIHALLIHFFALLKLECGSLDNSPCPDLTMVEDHLSNLDIHSKHFSFRELTLLSGYKTERAVRNLASPSTPEHRRIKVIKENRNTYVERAEVLRWLELNKKN